MGGKKSSFIVSAKIVEEKVKNQSVFFPAIHGAKTLLNILKPVAPSPQLQMFNLSKKEILNLEKSPYLKPQNGSFHLIKTHMLCCLGAEEQSEKQSENSRSRRAESRGRGGILCEILPKVYGRLKGLKAWRKLDQGESSPNFHYFQVV